MAIRIVSLNIRHGGGNRIARLANWIEAMNPSVVVFPEWRNNVSGKIIRDQLTENGFRTVATARATSKINSVLQNQLALRSLLIFDVARAVATVRKPFSVSRPLMIFPDTLFRHSGRTTTEGLLVASQSDKRSIRLPPPCWMLSDTIRTDIRLILRTKYGLPCALWLSRKFFANLFT